MVKEAVTVTPGVIDTITHRRSVRSGFANMPIDPQIVDEIVTCGLHAPSSKNAQPWKMHVVESKLTLNGIAHYIDMMAEPKKRDFIPHDPNEVASRVTYVSTVTESAEVLRQVSLGIFVENRGKFTANRQAVASNVGPELEDALIGVGLEYIGLGASIQNMWLAAEARGLRGVFMGDVLIAEKYIQAELGMTGDLVGVLALGYTADEPAPKVIQDNVVRHG